MELWNYYLLHLTPLADKYNIGLPVIPSFARHNAHIFYMVCGAEHERDHLTAELRKAGIQAYFHYPSLHLSRYYLKTAPRKELPNAERFSTRLLRLPLFIDLTRQEQDYIIEKLNLILSRNG